MRPARTTHRAASASDLMPQGKGRVLLTVMTWSLGAGRANDASESRHWERWQEEKERLTVLLRIVVALVRLHRNSVCSD